MKYYVDITHVVNVSAAKFEKQLIEVVNDYQNDGYFVEIQNGNITNVFSALVSAYVIKQSNDIIDTKFRG